MSSLFMAVTSQVLTPSRPRTKAPGLVQGGVLGYVNQALGAKVSRFPRGDRDTVLGEIALWYFPLLCAEQVPSANFREIVFPMLKIMASKQSLFLYGHSEI